MRVIVIFLIDSEIQFSEFGFDTKKTSNRYMFDIFRTYSDKMKI